MEICTISEELILTFDDSLHYFVAETFGLNLISLDSDFDKTDINRMHPKDVLKLLDNPTNKNESSKEELNEV